ncbi:putative branched-chain amino acid permease (azaleucine resistance) [Corynebacterium kutscheri]|uniref:Putative branched-chain amino acid permease (Azaleucine resistance) n=1 Tax=Corynebacterium kutscheri TaxID=35755 RepID=A0A0F6TEQ2_9CORY|nr:AzlC family ABC transporter permease [Corynebacterium kutscheri]AKE42276.1 putative branched-chain amino acid permease (azaleucine resistance) [Corynebacterium kutscheri]VEH10620.1 predicted branched-chain amino acid permease [Corynebacterium kutscheri]
MVSRETSENYDAENEDTPPFLPLPGTPEQAIQFSQDECASFSAQQEIRYGLKETWAVGVGLVPLGLAFGLLLSQTGFAWWWAPIFSIIIYAGSTEYLALGLITGGLGPISAALTGFMVNFRHLFYGLTFPRQVLKNPLARGYSAYALTDESYAIASVSYSRPMTAVRLMTIQITCHTMWVLSGVAGALIGQVIPPDIHGMDFALTALFVVLAWEAFQINKDFSLPICAILFALGAVILAPAQMLMIALSAYFLFLVMRFRSPKVDRRLSWRRAEKPEQCSYGEGEK